MSADFLKQAGSRRNGGGRSIFSDSRAAKQSVQRFMERLGDGVTEVGELEPVFDLALSADLDAARAGTVMLFGGVVESLADTFVSNDRKALERVLARAITRVRSLPQASAFDQRLSQWGLLDEDALSRRVDRLSTMTDRAPHKAAQITVLEWLATKTSAIGTNEDSRSSTM